MPTPEIKSQALYESEELAELFDIPTRDIRLLFKRGHIRGKKIGRRWFTSGRAILSLFDDCEDATDTDYHKTSSQGEGNLEKKRSMEETAPSNLITEEI